MRLTALVAAATFVAAGTAHAQVIQLTFEGIGDTEVIGDYYNGGPGGDLGVTFGNTAQAIITGTAGGSGNFQQPPSGTTIMFFPTASNAFMNVSGGFDTGFSLFYTAINTGGSVSVYSGFGGTGTLLATLALPTTPSLPNTSACPSFEAFCPFVAASIAFEGTAQSVVFSGSADQIGFDNITFGSTNPNVVPEPATLALTATGLVVLGGYVRRRRTLPS